MHTLQLQGEVQGGLTPNQACRAAGVANRVAEQQPPLTPSNPAGPAPRQPVCPTTAAVRLDEVGVRFKQRLAEHLHEIGRVVLLDEGDDVVLLIVCHDDD